MKALVLVGHGSLRADSGAAMLALAEAAQARGLAKIVRAGFLNFSEPSFDTVVEQCLQEGADEVVVQPYFLIEGYYVNGVLAKLVARARDRHPEVGFHVAEAFGYHDALVNLVLKRLEAAAARFADAVLLMAHGTPTPEANRPLYEVAAALEQRLERPVQLCFMELNTPGIADAAALFVARDHLTIAAVPYFLQLGGHVAEDIPETLQAVRDRHPGVEIVATEHLAYSPLLLEVVAHRSALGPTAPA